MDESEQQKSFQNLDISFSNELNNDSISSWYDLVQYLSTDHLEKLEKAFKSTTDGLNKENFLVRFNEICKNLNCDQHILVLFDLVNTKNLTKITWSDFLNFMLQNITPVTASSLNFQIQSIISVPQTQREAIVKIVLIETEKYFCYAVISKHGRVGLYDGNLNFLTTYQLIMTREDINRKEQDRRRRNRWVTDAIFCRDISMFIVTNTARSIIIYEASGLKHVPLWLILSTPNIVTSFTYKSSNIGEKKGSILYMGDDTGKIIYFIFLQPKVLLLRKKHNDKLSLFYWDELPEEKEYIIVKQIGKLHQYSIERLMYCFDNETIISCSRDTEASLVIKYVSHRSSPYIFKIPKGCNCFALSRERKILITGSQDGILRLWNPIITVKPIGILTGHQAPIVDLRIMDEQNLFISCSFDGMFKLWDISEQKCFQSFTINFPSFSVFGKLIEWGSECFYPGPKRFVNSITNNLEIWERSPMLVACCNHVALLKINFYNKEKNDNLELQVLPPPPLQNSVLVPKMWKTSDTFENFSSRDEENGIEEVDPAVLEQRLRELDFIIKKDLFENNISSNSDINFKIATLERKKLLMQQHVARGAPYLALDLHEVNKLSLTPDLPVPNRKKIKNIVENIEKVLQDASTRDLIFSEPSTSRSPRSSRSSIIEFDY